MEYGATAMIMNTNNKNIQTLERIQDQYIKRILNLPTYTPNHLALKYANQATIQNRIIKQAKKWYQKNSQNNEGITHFLKNKLKENPAWDKQNTPYKIINNIKIKSCRVQDRLILTHEKHTPANFQSPSELVLPKLRGGGGRQMNQYGGLPPPPPPPPPAQSEK